MSKKEPNNPEEYLTAAMNAYFKRATELEEQRAKADEKEINEIILKQLLPMHAIYKYNTIRR